jgi:signal transduction histidine kinase/ActR/RegA family two-component response regulator
VNSRAWQLRYAALIAGLLLLTVALAAGLATVRQASGSLAVWDREYSYWSAAQLELELWRLIDAADRRAGGDPAVDAGQLGGRIDILWSRIAVFDAGVPRQRLEQVDGGAAMLVRVKSTLSEREPALRRLAAGDPAYPEIRAAIAALEMPVHQIALRMNTLETKGALGEVERLQTHLGMVAALIAGIILAGIVLVAFLFLEIRVRRRLLAETRASSEAARQARHHLEQAIEAMPEGFAYFDGEHRLVISNGRFRAMLGRDGDRLHPGDQIDAVLRRAAEGGAFAGAAAEPEAWTWRRITQYLGSQESMELMLADGRCVQASVQRTADGGRVGIYTDVSKLKQIEEQLRAARDEAEAASKTKSEFLATVSHELRSPLHGVLSSLDLLQLTRLDGEQSGIVKGARASGVALLELIDDILDLTRLESGQLELESRPFAPGALLDSVVAMMGFRARQKGIGFRVHRGADVPSWLTGDSKRIRQILVNLVGNAVKFTEAGEVELTLQVGEGPDGDRLRFEVSDTGIGIPAEAVDRLFRDFSQLDAGRTRKYGGSGLGLAICRRLVGALGGAIGYAPRPKGGSLFWFELPLRLPSPAEIANADAAAAPPAAPPRRAARLLLVDDSPTNRAVTGALLRRAGHQVDLAADGHEAIAAAADRDYDLVLMDIAMPEMDGMAATAQIRGLPGRRSQVPIIAMTAHAMTSDRDRFLAAGMDGYIAKPIGRAQLEAAVQRWAGGGRQDAGADGLVVAG